jgi:hypothetical protein
VLSARDANDEVIATFLGKLGFFSDLRQFDFDKEFPRAGRLVAKVVGFNLPQRARSEHQRIEALTCALAGDKHIQTGEVVAWNLVGTLVMRLVSSTGGPGIGLHSGRSEGSDEMGGSQSGPKPFGVGSLFVTGSC